MLLADTFAVDAMLTLLQARSGSEGEGGASSSPKGGRDGAQGNGDNAQEGSSLQIPLFKAVCELAAGEDQAVVLLRAVAAYLVPCKVPARGSTSDSTERLSQEGSRTISQRELQGALHILYVILCVAKSCRDYVMAAELTKTHPSIVTPTMCWLLLIRACNAKGADRQSGRLTRSWEDVKVCSSAGPGLSEQHGSCVHGTATPLAIPSWPDLPCPACRAHQLCDVCKAGDAGDVHDGVQGRLHSRILQAAPHPPGQHPPPCMC